jgi:hypothetical protein
MTSSEEWCTNSVGTASRGSRRRQRLGRTSARPGRGTVRRQKWYWKAGAAFPSPYAAAPSSSGEAARPGPVSRSSWPPIETPCPCVDPSGDCGQSVDRYRPGACAPEPVKTETSRTSCDPSAPPLWTNPQGYRGRSSRNVRLNHRH